MNVVNLIFFIIFIITLIIAIYAFILSLFGKNNPTERLTEPTFCFLIPARDESKVIKNPLESITKQSVPCNMKDVYVIVEDINDPTVKIVEEYQANIFVRQKLNLKRKGYALDEVVKNIIKSGKHYDIYFIIDADNVLDENFTKYMIESYYKGYNITVAHRDSKNANESIVAGASSLTFAILDEIINEKRSKRQSNIGISGTGFFITGKYIEEVWQGFPFHCLTEDYEMTIYSLINEVPSTYQKKAIIYDEQPLTLKQSITQRVRWVRGFLDVRKENIDKLKTKYKSNKKKYKYLINDILGIKHFVVMLISIAGIFLNSLISGIICLFLENNEATYYFIISISIIVILYLILIIVTDYLIIKEGKNLSMNNKTKFKMQLFHPIFLITYIPCLFKALKDKEITWEKIDHKG